MRDRAKAVPISYLLWDKVPFYLIQEIVWNYGAGVAGSKFFSPRNEKFLWYVKNQNNYQSIVPDYRFAEAELSQGEGIRLDSAIEQLQEKFRKAREFVKNC